MCKFIYAVLLFFISTAFANAQHDTLSNNPSQTGISVNDSIASIKKNIRTDTINPHLIILKTEISKHSPIIDSILQIYYYQKLNSNYAWYNIKAKPHQKHKTPFGTGKALAKGESWLLITLCLWFIAFAILKNNFPEDFKTLLSSLFNKKKIIKSSQRHHLFSFRSFFFFILFSVIIGLFIYLTNTFFQQQTINQSFMMFIEITAFVLLVYIIKVIVLVVIDLLFNPQHIHEYVSFIYLSYFNCGIILTPIVYLFVLSPLKYGYICSIVGYILILCVFLIVLFKMIRNLLIHRLISILYLLLYLCALEIYPIIVLIKWLN